MVVVLIIGIFDKPSPCRRSGARTRAQNRAAQSRTFATPSWLRRRSTRTTARTFRRTPRRNLTAVEPPCSTSGRPRPRSSGFGADATNFGAARLSASGVCYYLWIAPRAARSTPKRRRPAHVSCSDASPPLPRGCGGALGHELVVLSDHCSLRGRVRPRRLLRVLVCGRPGLAAMHVTRSRVFAPRVRSLSLPPEAKQLGSGRNSAQ